MIFKISYLSHLDIEKKFLIFIHAYKFNSFNFFKNDTSETFVLLSSKNFIFWDIEVKSLIIFHPPKYKILEIFVEGASKIYNVSILDIK